MVNKDFLVIEFLDGTSILAPGHLWDTIKTCIDRGGKAVVFEGYDQNREFLVPVAAIRNIYRGL